MTTRRPSSAVEFRRVSSTSSNMEANSMTSIHVNPYRARTPRSNSITSQSTLPGSELDTTSNAPVDNESACGSDVTKASPNEKTSLLTKSKSIASDVAKNSLSSSGTQPTPPTITSSKIPTTTSHIVELLDKHGCSPSDPKFRRKAFTYTKIISLFAITVLCCAVIMTQQETVDEEHAAVLRRNKVILQDDICEKDRPNVRLRIHGPFYPLNSGNVSGSLAHFSINATSVFNLTVNDTALEHWDTVEIIEDVHCTNDESEHTLMAWSDAFRSIPVTWYLTELTWQLENEVIYAFLVLIFVYILIIFELVHRTLAALLGALAAMAVLSSLNERPTLDKVVEWIDMETLTLLFGMMILVAIFSETGFFDYSALVAYKLAKGKVWPLITLLCVFSAVVSAFLDNVTTILLVAPVTIRLCEVLNLDPRRILIAEVLFSNIGGTATAIGDPPNVIIVGALDSQGITFSTFTMHMFPGIVFISFVGYGLLRLYYRDMNELKNKDPPDMAEMKHEIAMWKRAASRLQVVTREETLMRALFLQKAVEIEHVMNKTLHKKRREESQDLRDTIKKLESQYCIKDYPLLLKSGIVLGVVMIFLFTYSFIDAIHLDIGWIAVLGALWLLVLADVEDIESILHKVEWSTLLFFAGLFVTMEALAELGMIKTIGDGIADIITSVNEEHRLLLAVIIILWVSAIASSFIDNIPYTTAMVPVLQQISENPNLDLPLLPLVVALAFGACLGGNGTLIGASCNVVCAGIAEQHGYGFSFVEFFKIGFPMMLVTTVAATVYVLICHVAITWNSV